MLEKHPAKLEEMGIQSIDHLTDVKQTDDTDFQFMTKFEFRQLIQEYKQCIELTLRRHLLVVILCIKPQANQLL